MTDQALIWIGLVSVAVGSAVGVVARDFIGEAIVDLFVERLAKRLQGVWTEDFEEALEPIKAELTTNGGSSVKDRVNDLWLRFGNLERQSSP